MQTPRLAGGFADEPGGNIHPDPAVGIDPQEVGMKKDLADGMKLDFLKNSLAFFTFGVNVAATKSRDDAKRLFVASIIYLPILLTTLMLNKTTFFDLAN